VGGKKDRHKGRERRREIFADSGFLWAPRGSQCRVPEGRREVKKYLGGDRTTVKVNATLPVKDGLRWEKSALGDTRRQRGRDKRKKSKRGERQSKKWGSSHTSFHPNEVAGSTGGRCGKGNS